MQTKPEEVVQAFAHALDRDDFEGALVLLSEDCVYEAREACHKGPLSILASYRDASDWAKRELQKVTYESTVLRNRRSVSECSIC